MCDTELAQIELGCSDGQRAHVPSMPEIGTPGGYDRGRVGCKWAFATRRCFLGEAGQFWFGGCAPDRCVCYGMTTTQQRNTGDTARCEPLSRTYETYGCTREDSSTDLHRSPVFIGIRSARSYPLPRGDAASGDMNTASPSIRHLRDACNST